MAVFFTAADSFAVLVITVCLSWAYLPIFTDEWDFVTSWDDDHNYFFTDIFKELSLSNLWRMWTFVWIVRSLHDI